MSGTLSLAHARRDFPILQQEVQGKPLVYLDNGATTQKPLCVVERLQRYYTHENANIHRGVHALSQQATYQYEGARETVQKFLGAQSTREIVFVRGTTEAVNLVAGSLENAGALRAGCEVLITHMEHHSNIVPWQMLCERTGATLRAIPLQENGALVDDWPSYINENTALVGVVHVSNALGTINPVQEITAAAHAVGARVLVDGAQAVAHVPVDVQQIGCDFYAFSGHKIYGPTGIGVLYGREEVLQEMPPWQGGGDMIRSVSIEKTTYNDLPHKFEAGTPDIAGVIGLGTALEYFQQYDVDQIQGHEQELVQACQEGLLALGGIRIVGTAPRKTGLVSFTIDGLHPHDIGTILDSEGVAIRAGHHCAQPVMQHFGIPATARASFGLYNNHNDVDALLSAVAKAKELFGV